MEHDRQDGIACLKRKNGGAVIVRTHLCIIVGTYSEKRFLHASLANCSFAVYAFAQNLKSFNF